MGNDIVAPFCLSFSEDMLQRKNKFSKGSTITIQTSNLLLKSVQQNSLTQNQKYRNFARAM